jgi:hypothetical protein
VAAAGGPDARTRYGGCLGRQLGDAPASPGQDLDQLLGLLVRQLPEDVRGSAVHDRQRRVDDGRAFRREAHEDLAAIRGVRLTGDQAALGEGVQQRGDARRRDQQPLGDHVGRQRLTGSFQDGQGLVAAVRQSCHWASAALDLVEKRGRRTDEVGGRLDRGRLRARELAAEAAGDADRLDVAHGRRDY